MNMMKKLHGNDRRMEAMELEINRHTTRLDDIMLALVTVLAFIVGLVIGWMVWG